MQNKLNTLGDQFLEHSAKMLDPDKKCSAQDIATLGAMGATWLALKDLVTKNDAPKPKREIRAISDNVEETGFAEIKHAKNKLNGAQEYFDLWMETREKEYRDIALDELRHSEFFITKAKENPEIKAEEVDNLKVWHDALMAKLA